jgi:hypothetical protein
MAWKVPSWSGLVGRWSTESQSKVRALGPPRCSGRTQNQKWLMVFASRAANLLCIATRLGVSRLGKIQALVGF